MTVMIETSDAIEKRSEPVESNESMRAVLTAIRHELSLDPTKSEKQIKKRMGDLATAVNHIAKSLKKTPEQLTVSEAVESESIFLDYLEMSRFSPANKTQLPSRRNAVLRYARNLDFSPACFALLDEWDPVLKVLSLGSGATAIANDAIRHKRHRVDFSEADLSVWADAKLAAGRSFIYVMRAQAAFRTAIREAKLQGLLPQLDPVVLKPMEYRLRVQNMAASLREEISEIVDSRRAQAAVGTVSMASATEHELIEHFEEFCGYAVRIREMENVVGLRPLLNEPFVKAFAFWLHKERKCKRTTIVGRISRMFSALKTSPLFRDCDFTWVNDIYRKLRKEPESALKERRRRRYVSFQELASIPKRMHGERVSLGNLSPASFGFRIHDEVLLACLIMAQWPSRFVRLAELGRNVFKGPIPKEGPPFSVPPWAKVVLSENPNAEFWQFRYESPRGQLHRGLILRDIVPLLELYLETYRPLLVDPAYAAHLFCNRSGRPLSCALLGKLVSYQIWRYLRKRVTLTAIRSSFAYFWRDRHPNKDAVLAQIQWVDYATIKMRYDEEFRKQRRARASRRKESC